MTKEEFIKLCHTCGYASMALAKEYVKDKDELTDEDFIRIYRLKEDNAVHRSTRFRYYGTNGARTTKRLKYNDD